MGSRVRKAFAYVPVCDDCNWLGSDWVSIGNQEIVKRDATDELNDHRESAQHRRNTAVEPRP